ncbi:lasso RiPP family leader peptide-containing protein [Arenicella xantha]|nr:lasso RiPP family leader peptide-containing protein [Arenicella xantha]
MNNKREKMSVASVEKTDVASTNSARKPYQKPVLTCYGDVRDVTLGPTFGGGESGCEGIFKVGPGGCPGP